MGHFVSLFNDLSFIATENDVFKFRAEEFSLTEDELGIMIPSGTQSVFYNRVGWARTYLKKANLINSENKRFY
ncbi:winged helix-turn-helix domain-containing protein [Treponema pectinovorum]|uniref:winged helix-turn-helix domain-containing protein n=1 Tax=Treponema pectinovorum TaxID=164 RepID=UPI001C065C8C